MDEAIKEIMQLCQDLDGLGENEVALVKIYDICEAELEKK